MRQKIFALLVAVGLSSSVLAHDHGCKKSKDEFRCVLKSYSAIHEESPEYFWKVLNRTWDAALSCTSKKAAVDFLRLASLPNQSAELEEFVSEGIEKICVNQPECFRDAMGKLDEKSRVAVKKKLANPTYFESSELVGCYGKRQTKKAEVKYQPKGSESEVSPRIHESK